MFGRAGVRQWVYKIQAERQTIESFILRPFLGSRALWGPGGGGRRIPPPISMPSDRQRQTPTSPPTDSSEEVPGVIDAVRQLLVAIDRNPEYVAGILHGAAHREQLDSLRNAIDRATDQAVVWQRPKGGGRQWHASNKVPPREPSPSAPATPSTSRTHQSTGASSSTHTAPPVVTPTMVPPNVTAVTWDQLQEMMGRMLDARLASTGNAASTTTGTDGQTTEVQPEPAVQPEPPTVQEPEARAPSADNDNTDRTAGATDSAGAQSAGASTDNDNTDRTDNAADRVARHLHRHRELRQLLECPDRED